MEFFTKFPVMERVPLMELKKGIDLSFRLFSRKYGDGIENFFDPLLFFFSMVGKIIINNTLANNNFSYKYISLVWF